MSINQELTIKLREITLAAGQSAGIGAPVLLLHGSGASSKVFRHQLESSVGDMFRLVAIDLPGHGASDNSHHPARDYSIAGLAEIVSEAMDTLQLGGASVVGWSLGGHVAIQLAATRSDIAGLMLTGTPPVGPGPLASLRGFHARWDLLLASKVEFSEADAQRFLRLCYGRSGTPEFLQDIRRSDGRLRQHFFRSLMRGGGVDQKQALETADFPVAMVNGEDDPNVRRSYIEHFNYAELWQNRCFFLPGADHAPFWQQPAAFNRLLYHFAQDMAQRPTRADHFRAARA